MSDYRRDRQWSDRFIPTIKAIVGPYLLSPAPIELDQKSNTDLMIFTARDLTISCRIRRPGFSERYPNQFTIRAMRDTGAETEMSKVINGFGDWMFYGHADEDEVSIGRWMLIDLNAFRAHLIISRSVIVHGRKPNGDGTHFNWFDASSFPSPPKLLIADSENDFATSVNSDTVNQ